MLIDTHCHLDFKDFDGDRDDVIERAASAGVKYIINVGSSIEGSMRALELAGRYDGIFASLGVHPHDADKVDEVIISAIRDMAKDAKVIAIGEIGLDYYKNSISRDIQKCAFKRFIALSRELDLPLIIHNREATGDVLGILREEYKGAVRGVMHCFSGDLDTLNQCLEMGLFISFTCNITFKNASRLREVASRVPIEKLLLETDAPFLAPQAYRGKRNEPSYLKYLVGELARVKGAAEKEIEEITTRNAIALFALER